MRRAALASLAFLLFFLASPARAQDASTGIAITAPASGEVIFGAVTITGTTDVEGFLSAEIAFSYADAPTTWFVIWSGNQAVQDGPLTTWDTTVLTDGRYTLRLRVFLADGSTQEVFVDDLRIQNDTPTETPTPTKTPPPTATFPPPTTPQPATATPTLPPTPTSLPPNPAALTPDDLLLNLERGVLITLLSFAAIGLILRMRRR